ncbi:MAG: hypothetical protein ACOC07_06675 [Coleofasciculus sp.]
MPYDFLIFLILGVINMETMLQSGLEFTGDPKEMNTYTVDVVQRGV